LASWSEVPVNLARDKTWTYISHALALAVELRLDTPVPYYVQVDPGITVRDRELFIRNAVSVLGALYGGRRSLAEFLYFCFVLVQHRCCMLLYIHDRVCRFPPLAIFLEYTNGMNPLSILCLVLTEHGHGSRSISDLSRIAHLFQEQPCVMGKTSCESRPRNLMPFPSLVVY
jgi:hypothetical protein